MVRPRRILLALTMLSPLALYTSRLPAALNPIRKRAIPRRDLFRDLRPSFVGIGALTDFAAFFFFSFQKRGISPEKS